MPDEPISVACPHCSIRLKLKDPSALGKTIKCPKCAQSFTAQVSAPAAAATVGAAAPTKKKRPPPEAAPPEDEGDDGEEPADEAPRKKKKKGKKKRKKQASGPPMGLIIGISAFVFLLVAGGVVAMIVINKGGGGSRSSASVAAPELEHYQGPVYSLMSPKGWEKQADGAENHQWVEFTSGPAMVRAQNDSAGVGDLLSGPNRGVKMDDHTQEVIHGVHLGKGETLAEELSGYEEGEPVPFDCKMGMGRWSEFSFTEGWGPFKKKMKGIRATVQSGTKTVIMRCVCPEKMFETLKPVFVKIVTSAGPGLRQ
jgi:hypothetical protein